MKVLNVKQSNQSSMKFSQPFIKTLLLITLMFVGFQVLEAQNIPVPAANKVKASPIVFNAAVVKEGLSIYDKNCMSCHGNPGKGNFLPAFVPPPADLATAKSQSQTDGELFYRTSEGNTIMPKFKTTLSEVERWKIVGYIRSFNKKYVQPPVILAPNLLTKTVQIDFKYDSITNKISLYAFSVIKKDTTRLKGSDELLFVKRYFGGMQLGPITKSNDKGIAIFDFPKHIPGDKDGNIVLEARINDNIYGEVMLSKKIKIGVPTNVPGLTENRAIWNVESKAPIWLMLTYFSILIGVWSTIAYIVFNMFRLRKSGTKIIN
jgi:mono/diheme cytochrome c family protein